MPVTVSHSEIEQVSEQADGTRLVTERHQLSNGQVVVHTYHAQPGIDIDQVLAERAGNIEAALAEREKTASAAADFTLPLMPSEFMLRFTVQERLAIRQAAQSDPVIADFMTLLAAATQGVDTHAQSVQDGIQYLVSQGLLAPERVAEILA